MAKIKWIDAAKNSDNEEIKALLNKYENTEVRSEKEKARDEIINLLTSKESDKPQEEPQTVEDEETIEDNKSKREKEKSDKYAKIKEIREEIVAIEKTRLKNPTYEERMEFNKKIKEKEKKIIAIRNVLRKEKIEEKERIKRQSGQVSSIKMKQAKILKLLRQGTSFSNITKHSDGVKKEEITQVIENDSQFMEEMQKINKKLPKMWLSWKQKFVTLKR